MKNTANIKSRLAYRVIGRPSTFTMSTNGTPIQSVTQQGISGEYYDYYAQVETKTSNFNLPSDNFVLDVTFSNPSSADNAWIDYFEINCERALTMIGEQMPFRHISSLSSGTIAYSLSGLSGNNIRVWNVTQPINVFESTIRNGIIKESGGQINEFIAFSPTGYLTPALFNRVPNQNIHAIQTADYVIITHPNYINQANQLAKYHQSNSKLNTVVVTTNQIYNEFSSGAQDITAIKIFNKMLYDRAGSDTDKLLKYVLLLGDASYDYKHRIANNTNQVPSYQSENSIHPIQSYVTDDYFGFLDDNESDALNSTLDIGIGRIMSQNESQAQAIVNKTIDYLTNPNNLRPWRNKITIVADDEDGNIHMRQSDEIATKITTEQPLYNINKIYLDAYKQVSNAGGSTYPDANTALDKANQTGSLVINYAGHGGELGLAHERVLGIPQIRSYTNIASLPLYLTATCEFSRFDDPERTSAGELILLNDVGGALALLTTTRLVYSNENFNLSNRFYDAFLTKVDGQHPRLGDLLRISKVDGSSINTRNFTLLGDPAAQLAFPRYYVHTTLAPDTLKSLEKITITGVVTDADNQQIHDFNGLIYPAIYGQKQNLATLNNDGVGVFNFTSETNVLFNGKATVKGGAFSFSFVVPKDIDFNYGNGKISYYGENGHIDATGLDTTIIIGGIGNDPSTDQTGPIIGLWMNDETFVDGGLTDENPLIFSKISDQSGINTVGNGIGHDIVAILDENTTNPIVLNDYYESDLDTYKTGYITYKLSDLSNGKHTLRLKIWDVYNNSSEAFTEFVVSNSDGLHIERVLNYPNPFTTSTDFYFNHNALSQTLNVRIQIYSISGKLVKTIDHTEYTTGFQAGPIHWDGRDQYGDRIGRGTYIYSVKVRDGYQRTVDKFEKIVIL